jgi:hypothetical protein
VTEEFSRRGGWFFRHRDAPSTPKRRTPLTAKHKVAVFAKAKATLAARHTMSAKEKAKITGVTAAAAAAAAGGTGGASKS